MTTKPNKRTSDIIGEVADKLEQKEALTIGDFVSMLGDRSFGLAILIFALPNAIPVPGIPGFSALTGAPIIIIALQMVFGARKIWLPKFVSKRKMQGRVLTLILKKSVVVLRMVEKFLRPRLQVLTSKTAEKVIGIFLCIVAWVLALPIPLGNFLPGVALSTCSLALLERDGFFMIVGLLLSVIAVVVVSGMVVGAVMGVNLLLH